MSSPNVNSIIEALAIINLIIEDDTRGQNCIKYIHKARQGKAKQKKNIRLCCINCLSLIFCICTIYTQRTKEEEKNIFFK